MWAQQTAELAESAAIGGARGSVPLLLIDAAS